MKSYTVYIYNKSSLKYRRRCRCRLQKHFPPFSPTKSFRHYYNMHRNYKTYQNESNKQRQQNITSHISHKRIFSSSDKENSLYQHSHIKFSPSLTPDCFAEILVHLQDDKSTLYNCLLLNRLCCRLVMPLLWKRPFDLIQQSSFVEQSGNTTSSYNSLERNAALIIKTYVSCLPPSELRIYSEEGMNIPRMIRPLFDYPIYLKSFDTSLIYSSIEYFFKNLLRNTRLMHYKSPSFNPTTYLAQWIFNKSNALHSLNYHYITEDALKSIDLSTFKNTESKLHHLKKFNFIYIPRRTFTFINDIKPIISNLFLTLSNTSININQVKLFLHKNSSPPIQQICNFLSSLRCLTTFKSNEFWLNNNSNSLEIFYSLSKHLNTLEYLEFTDLSHFSRPLLEFLSNCKKLKVLEFKGFEQRHQSTSNDDDYLFNEDCSHCYSPENVGNSNNNSSRGSSSFGSIWDNNNNTSYTSNLSHSPSYDISVENLIIHRNHPANSIIPLLKIISPFSLKKLYIENTTPEIINIISSLFISNLTHLSIRPSNNVSFTTFAACLKKLLKRKDCNLESFSLKVAKHHDVNIPDDLRSILGVLQKRVTHLTLDIGGLCDDNNSLQKVLKSIKCNLKYFDLIYEDVGKDNDYVDLVNNFLKKNKDIKRVRFIINEVIAANVKNIIRNVKAKSKRNLEVTIVKTSNQLLSDWSELL
ncbi:hypothetical protein RclHR1_16540001 [Rhizophagus clarus]|uniref:F-box domain-containing protein n=1 Tax=Rhizophagus clarus TaxID=94130 RepID=A0A2Z6QM24_9GLOM|nr:hypothetical protein RclHR1_16540001 [Rhizophagus clarus]GES94017.1 hypothetical protein GLOIN_2v1499094 [Rhizophagus clarus]